MSATALAEYLILQSDGQETILHDSRFSRPPIVAANGNAIRALTAYNTDPRRDIAKLDQVKAALRAKAADPDTKPKAKDEALRCVEAIERFQRHENPMGMRGLPLIACPKLEPLIIQGVTLSIRPHFLVDASDGTVGAGMIRVAKAPDPDACRLDETRRRRGEHRREMARYLVAMLQMLLEAQRGLLGTSSRDL